MSPLKFKKLVYFFESILNDVRFKIMRAKFQTMFNKDLVYTKFGFDNGIKEHLLYNDNLYLPHKIFDLILDVEKNLNTLTFDDRDKYNRLVFQLEEIIRRLEKWKLRVYYPRNSKKIYSLGEYSNYRKYFNHPDLEGGARKKTKLYKIYMQPRSRSRSRSPKSKKERSNY